MDGQNITSSASVLASLELKAAIHIGASSISFLITDLQGQRIDYLEKSTSLAHDIFSKGSISRTTTENCVSILQGYSRVLQEYGITTESSQVRIVATNILSEASNKNIFINRVQVGCNISVEILDNGEMTQLIYLKTKRHLTRHKSVDNQNTLVVHAGPGNTRILFFKDDKIDSYNSFRIGTHRLKESMRKNTDSDEQSTSIIEETVLSQIEKITEEYAGRKIDEIIVIGYEIQQISEHIPAKYKTHHTHSDLKTFIDSISPSSDDEIVNKFSLDFHTTENLIPALIINKVISEVLNIKKIIIPSTDYESGLLQDILHSQNDQDSYIDEVLGSTWDLAKKFRVNKKHAKQVTKLSLQLFDGLSELHQLNKKDRLMLHCAAILHECGGFISSIAHHKHSFYLIINSDIFGLSKADLLCIGHIARYHRNSPPKPSHITFSELPIPQQMRISKLASLLRVADSLDRAHSSRIGDISIKVTKKRLHLYLSGVNDISLERLAIKQKGNLFQDIFGLDITLHEGD